MNMNPPVKPNVIVLVLSIVALALAASTLGYVILAAPRARPQTIYKQLTSSVNTSCCAQQEYPLVTANFSTSVATNATIFTTVTVFVPVSAGCCIGAFAIQLSIDNGPLQQIGGGDTSRTIGIRITLTAFDRLSFGAGTHSVTMAVYNGGGSWTVDSGRLTALLIEFD